ncbi:S-adenosyl-L-methionine-dependent methyltransferase [Fomitopsis serialis]|uniref:S-adenosyl-L-methionine-dependent methyltransferase n=1 Tax=Fomitopsis serialis TaxID=139415 RepID=UPI0020083F8C|nr:S-adenosyl-L-methionine-dependent methyltransferase [Neoantrodia serialis]KAH9925252.1 S-adenosyl-L-methionine-dependent methyltransferase [Neoantrodia serialis]
MAPSNRVNTLRSLIQLLVNTSELIIKEWEAEEQLDEAAIPTNNSLPSHELFEARRIMRGACGVCMDMVDDPRVRLLEISLSYGMSQALETTVRAGVPDVLAEAEPLDGVSAVELSRRTGVDEQKLVRVMRLLCSGGIYDEVKPLQFTNTRFSSILAGNPPAKAYQCLYGTRLLVGATEHLPATLLDPEVTRSTSVTECAFQKAFGPHQTLWGYIEEGDEADPAVREAREVFPLAMVGQGQMGSPSLIADYPWGSLGEATVVDVGGGVGSMCIELAKLFPDLRFVVEDLTVSIDKATSIWNAEVPGSIDAGRVQLLRHDFFEEQPVKDAAVYFLRYIMHDWPDDQCVTILNRLREAMGPHSRILVADMIIHPPLGSTYLKPAPAPLPTNYGRANAFKGMHDMWMLSLFNGGERTPEQLGAIAARAGLKIEKIWECRGPVGITELRRM